VRASSQNAHPSMRLNFHRWYSFDSLADMKFRDGSVGFVWRTSGTLLLAGMLACNSTSLRQPADAGSAGSTGVGGGAGGGSGGAPGSGGKSGSSGGAGAGGVSDHGGTSGTGGTPGSGGKAGSGGAPVSSGGTGAGGFVGSGGALHTGGSSASGGGTGTGGVTVAGGSDGGRDAPAASDASPEAAHADAAQADRADTAIINPSDASGGGADVLGTDALSPGAQAYVNAYLQPYCTRLAECCAQAGLAYSGIGACEAYELGFVKYLDDGSEVIVPSVIQTVLDQIKTSCDQPSYALIVATTDGTRTSGQPCVAVDQCAGTPALCLDGTCMTPPRGKAGDGCAVTCDDNTDCKWGTSGGKSPNAVCYDQDGLRCDSTTNTCVAVTAVGKACTEYAECGTHAECLNGICQAYAQVGQECNNGRYCDSSHACMSNSSGTKSTCQTLSLAWSGSCSP